MQIIRSKKNNKIVLDQPNLYYTVDVKDDNFRRNLKCKACGDRIPKYNIFNIKYPFNPIESALAIHNIIKPRKSRLARIKEFFRLSNPNYLTEIKNKGTDKLPIISGKTGRVALYLDRNNMNTIGLDDKYTVATIKNIFVNNKETSAVFDDEYAMSRVILL
ncbi:MAG: hypothetical protein RLZZ210_101 [Pseudomonadota bacterium]|jgi:hypothetical protein